MDRFIFDVDSGGPNMYSYSWDRLCSSSYLVFKFFQHQLLILKSNCLFTKNTLLNKIVIIHVILFKFSITLRQWHFLWG